MHMGWAGSVASLLAQAQGWRGGVYNYLARNKVVE